jgi:adenylate kinase
MGKILRSVANSDNKYSEVVKNTLNKGELVPDEYTRLIAWDFINKHNPKISNFVFEGYPRTLAQYEQLKDMLAKFGRKIDKVINIEISEEETVKRLSARRTCLKCGEVYNMVSNPPPKPNECTCGGDLIQREDDKPDAIRRRLQIYRNQTHPVFDKSMAEGVGVEIDGERPIEDIYSELLMLLKHQEGNEKNTV